MEYYLYLQSLFLFSKYFLRFYILFIWKAVSETDFSFTASPTEWLAMAMAVPGQSQEPAGGSQEPGVFFPDSHIGAGAQKHGSSSAAFSGTYSGELAQKWSSQISN